jgi:signal transduction histidine kinase
MFLKINFVSKQFVLSLFVFFCIYSTLLGQQKSIIDSINKLDYVYISNNLQEAKGIFSKNIKDAKQLNYKKGEAIAYTKLSLMYGLLGDFKTGIVFDQKALKIFEEIKDFQSVANTYAGMGYSLRHVDYQQSVDLFRKAISIGKKIQNNADLSAIYNNYGEVIKEKQIDSALYFFKKSLEIAQKNKDSIGIPFSLNKISETYARKKDFKKAFYYLDLSDSYRFASKDTFGIADNIAYRGDIFYEIPQVDSAIFHYEKALKLANQTNFNALLRFCSKRLANLYKRKKNFNKAFHYLEMNKNLEDSVLNSNVKNEIANLQIRYDSERKQREIAEKTATIAKQKEINSNNELQLEARKRWMIIGYSFAFLIILISLWAYRNQKVKLKTKKREFELKQQLEKAILEKSFAEEKNRISRELHDNIGSHLTFMISSLDNLPYTKDPEKRLVKLTELSNFGRLTMKDLRDTIWAMNHDGGTLEELITRINELRKVLPSNIELKINNQIEANHTLNGLQLLNLYRIVQESIQNTIKYANALNIEIYFSNNENSLYMEIKDDGKGFDIENQALGNGILNMKKRCEDINGSCIIESNKLGTRILCTFENS